jgi:hypothetical protein
LIDSRATDHLTHDLERLNVHERYLGKDQVQVANGAGLSISHIGNSCLASHMHSLALKNILHIPDISKNLLSVNRIVSDNDVFIKFHHHFVCVEDKATKKIILKVEAAWVFIQFCFIELLHLLGMRLIVLSFLLGNGIIGLVIRLIM